MQSHRHPIRRARRQRQIVPERRWQGAAVNLVEPLQQPHGDIARFG
jgi:hypothetical protein